MIADLAVVSAADSEFFDLLQGMVRSLRDKPEGRDIPLHIIDVGLSDVQRQWLLTQGARLLLLDYPPEWDNAPHFLRAFLPRCRIPDYFPGHDVYLWIDADAWIQSWDAVELYVEGALSTGFAITAESDPAYDRDCMRDTHEPTFAMFGSEYLERFRSSGVMNAGVFAGRADAPHWQEWRQVIDANIANADTKWLLFLLDQTALSIVCTRSDLETTILPSTCNWMSHWALPMTSDDGSQLIRPLAPHEKLGIVHQTAHTKRRFYALPRQGGGRHSRTLCYQAHSQLAADDYVSPGLHVILPDQCFPNMIRGDQSASTWQWLRRGLAHGWLVDRHRPASGFLNRDEAHILYNLALGFHGKRALEIGCLMGWSACHIALAGLDLDIIDPSLEDPEVMASVKASLIASCPAGQIGVTKGSSPAAVHQMAGQRPEGWSFFMIDGDHDGDAPVKDVEACLPYATPDCAMVFHDLASPDVTNAVLHLKALGWKTRVYHTAQIMAVAWRGNVHPIAHQPDPRIEWEIPRHVMYLLV
jgi:predicted O-methyltransferase YrrM